MTAGRYILTFLVLLSLLSSTFAQKQKSKAQLQKEKQENLAKIKQTEKILDETAVQKKNSLGELNALNERITEQEKLITSIQSEVNLLDKDIDENMEIINALEVDLKNLKDEYAAMIFSAQKASGKIDKLTFLFSAQSFDQLIMRLKYMEQYGAARQDQVEAIIRVQKVLEDQVQVTQEIKKEKNDLLKDEVRENESLSNLKSKQKRLISSLEKEEKKLRKDLDETKKAIAKLDKYINDIIKEEIAKAEREAAAAAAAKTKTNVVSVSTALSTSFEDNKAKFAWPVSGFVSQKFGRQKHPVLKGIVLQNDGINIQTQQNEKVKAIFDGEVRAVAFVQSIGITVIINHGDYFTVYSGLKEVFVKQGQKVNTGTEIGQVLVNGDGISELRFQIRKNTLALDPQTWLTSK
ncbi:MAG: peptidoglycan DD-metalloendopeptidase family protein [Flammeovirgaceae bacterium]|nr:peptidoglycan DD-metalloendopeptidase family protein [Flammeovirgaceae bacterium]